MSPSLAVALRSLLDYEILSYTNVWPAVAGLTVALTVVLSVIYRKTTLSGKAKLVVLLAVAVGTFIYSYGVIIHYNCSCDTSVPQVYPARVVDKRMRVGDYTDRYLKVTAWGPQQDTTEVKVGKGLYGRTETGDELRGLLYGGKLGVPWYVLKDK